MYVYVKKTDQNDHFLQSGAPPIVINGVNMVPLYMAQK